MRGVSGGVETKAAESVHVRVCGAGVRGARARGRRAAGRHFSVLEEPRYTSVSGGCSLADSQVYPAAPGPRAGHVASAHLLATPRFFTRTSLIKHF